MRAGPRQLFWDGMHEVDEALRQRDQRLCCCCIMSPANPLTPEHPREVLSLVVSKPPLRTLEQPSSLPSEIYLS